MNLIGVFWILINTTTLDFCFIYLALPKLPWIMKPLYFVIFFSPQFFIGQQSALLGIDFGMTKTQVKKEINTNKKTYKKIRLGGYFWRLYHQNNRYNVNGELTTIKLTPTDGWLYGLQLNEPKLIFDAAIRRFKE